jgi:hypothetical protein
MMARLAAGIPHGRPRLASAASLLGRRHRRLQNDSEGGQISDQHLVIRRGRHVGWWIEGRAGRGFIIWDWWPTKRLALMVARFWARGAKRVGAGEITIEVRDATG